MRDMSRGRVCVSVFRGRESPCVGWGWVVRGFEGGGGGTYEDHA